MAAGRRRREEIYSQFISIQLHISGPIRIGCARRGRGRDRGGPGALRAGRTAARRRAHPGAVRRLVGRATGDRRPAAATRSGRRRATRRATKAPGRPWTSWWRTARATWTATGCRTIRTTAPARPTRTRATRTATRRGDACDITIVAPVGGGLPLACSGPPPALEWTPEVYDRFKVQVATHPSFADRATGGAALLRGPPGGSRPRRGTGSAGRTGARSPSGALGSGPGR